MTSVPRRWGWPIREGGRAANVETAARYTATTSQVCGLYPFAVSSGAVVQGVPIGRHLHTSEPVGLDPAEWLRTGLVSNTGVWVQGQPGIGKSSITKRLVVGLVGFGMTAVIPGDVKGEYSDLVDALGGSVWRIGRGAHTLNPLDAGPLAAAQGLANERERDRIDETIRARRLSLLEALTMIVRRGEITVTERRLLGAALDLVVGVRGTSQPLIPDILHVLTAPTEDLVRITASTDAQGFLVVARDLINTLGLLCEGSLRGIFDRASTVSPDLDSPALSLDLSLLDDEDDDAIAAAMLCAWAWSAGVIDAGAAQGRRRNVVQIQDELWRALRVAPGLVERSDRITRLNRHRGVVSVQVPHSLDDLEALPTEADRAKARGMASRTGILVLGGMAEKELDGLRRIAPLTDAEASLVTSWAAPPTWHSEPSWPVERLLI
ncbi:hypothetical protein [Pseudonocardia xishanensis]|uniref:ATPase n=1 Tax=Pseudonocardia xishanensis TaxID=630995 RepID=A0ABP8S263_9PSEU